MRILLTLMASLLLFACDGQKKEEAVVNLYSSQKEHLIRPVLEQFTKDTGIAVNLITGGNAELVTKLEYEGKNTPADLLLTVDIGNVYNAKQKGLLLPIKSEVLNAAVPETLRDPEGQWYALTTRVRLIFYHKDRVEPGAIHSYLDLADPKWKGRVLIRSSDNAYNQSLMAALVAHYGEEKALEWAKGLVANMARAPQGGDTDQLKALLAGEGDMAVANSYYYGRMVSEGNAEAAEKIGIVFPDQDGNGTHVNIRGGGVTRHAKHPENAQRLLEYLMQEPAQHFFADANLEYPANPAMEANPIVKAWGDFKRDGLPLEAVAKAQPAAITLMDKAGWR